jgi:hypothetical protein
MSYLTSNLSFGTYGVQYDFYQNRFYGGDTYFHYKTNIPMNNIMCMIEAVGYAYGANAAIRSTWSFYAYSAGNTTISIGLANYYSAMTAHGVYKSSDGYACIRANVASYYTGWSFNAYCLNPTGAGFQVSMLAAVQTSNSGNYY